MVKGVRAVYPDIKAQQPDGLNSEIIYDPTEFVNSSISEVDPHAASKRWRSSPWWFSCFSAPGARSLIIR